MKLGLQHLSSFPGSVSGYFGQVTDMEFGRLQSWRAQPCWLSSVLKASDPPCKDLESNDRAIGESLQKTPSLYVWVFPKAPSSMIIPEKSSQNSLKAVIFIYHRTKIQNKISKGSDAQDRVWKGFKCENFPVLRTCYLLNIDTWQNTQSIVNQGNSLKPTYSEILLRLHYVDRIDYWLLSGLNSVLIQIFQLYNGAKVIFIQFKWHFIFWILIFSWASDMW